MKKILSIIATSLLWVSSAEAGVPLVQEQGNSRYTIQLDSISMTIDTSLRQSWKTYIELESQGAYTTLEPDQSLTWTVRWYLRRVNGDPTLPLLLEAIK